MGSTKGKLSMNITDRTLSVRHSYTISLVNTGCNHKEIRFIKYEKHFNITLRNSTFARYLLTHYWNISLEFMVVLIAKQKRKSYYLSTFSSFISLISLSLMLMATAAITVLTDTYMWASARYWHSQCLLSPQVQTE